MTTLLLAGATGLVGQSLLQQALDHPGVSRVVGLTRRPLPAHPRLLNPIVDFEALPATAAWWHADAVCCALGTTRRAAGSDAAFERVDHDYPLQLGLIARQRGIGTYVLVSAAGANARSRLLYPRTKGRLEVDLARLGFASLTCVRPGLLGGHRNERRRGEAAAQMLLRALHPLLPRGHRMVAPEVVARACLDAALLAKPGHHVIAPAALADPMPGL